MLHNVQSQNHLHRSGNVADAKPWHELNQNENGVHPLCSTGWLSQRSFCAHAGRIRLYLNTVLTYQHNCVLKTLIRSRHAYGVATLHCDEMAHPD
jgi:hypothetical protein